MSQFNNINPVKKENLSEHIVKQLKGMIARRELQPGQKLPSEQELAETFGVGRHTIREALKKMAVMGLVESRVGDGSYITENTPKDVLGFMTGQLLVTKGDMDQLMELRKVLEISSAGFAAERATEGDIRDLEFHLAQMEAVAPEGIIFVAEDLKFHFTIAKATHNEFYSVVLNAVRDMLTELQQEVVMTEGAIARALNYHRLIYHAIKDNDPVKARQYMEEHLENTHKTILLFKGE